MFDTIADMLRGSAPDDLAHALGTDRTQTRRAMEIGLPALITGLRDKALEPGGAQSLASMLAEPAAALPADVDAYLSAGDPAHGAAMLDTAFGDRGEPALSSLAEASGLSTRLLAQVMSVLAPLATGVLRTAAPDDADGLRSYLAGSVDDLEAKGFGRVVELVSPELVPVAEVSGPVGVVVDDVDAGATVVEGAFPDPADLDAPDLDPGLEVTVGDDLGADTVLDLDSPDLVVPAATVGLDTAVGADLAAPDVAFDGTEIIDPNVDFEHGRSLSGMGWLWWAIAAILALLVLFFALQQCGGDDPVATETVAQPTATPDPVEIERETTLRAVLADYPGVSGRMVSGVAELTGHVDSLDTAAALDSAVRAAGFSVANHVTYDEAPAVEGYSLNDLVDAQPELSTLRSLLDQAGLGGALAGNGPFTLLAPTNDSFAAMDPPLAEIQGDPELLKAYLQYHLLSGTETAGSLAQKPSVQTMQQDSIDITTENGTIWFNNSASVLVPDRGARNGVMHIIGGVLVPPSSIPIPEELSAALQLAPITFSSGSDQLTDAGRTELDKVVAYLLENPVSVTIGGHTDSEGDEGFNQTLSQDRANAVKDYLVAQGIPSDSLVAVGFGETLPLVANDTAENKAKNRRIEFVTG